VITVTVFVPSDASTRVVPASASHAVVTFAAHLPHRISTMNSNARSRSFVRASARSSARRHRDRVRDRDARSTTRRGAAARRRGVDGIMTRVVVDATMTPRASRARVAGG
jgi:hypothetical protein